MNTAIRNRMISLLVLCLFAACQKNMVISTDRTYRMGFQNSAPSLNFNQILQSLALWTQRSDAAMISGELPWDSLINGETADNYIINNYLGLANYYRSKNLKLWVYLDPENGLNRSSDADDLVALGKSIAQSDIQLLYRSFALAMDSILQPDHMGLALETNLIRGAAPDSVYQGVRQAVNAAAQDIRNFDKKVPLGVSIQVDYAWGELSNSGYIGVSQDFVDFPFIEELGLSSYPYFAFSSPGDIPVNYYSKIIEGRSLPVFVSEGGWTSQTISGFSGQTINSSPLIQQQYIDRQNQLLEQVGAVAWFQLTFTDIDLSSLPPSTPVSIKYFAYLGLVDLNLQPKPALSSWDSLFRISLKPGN